MNLRSFQEALKVRPNGALALFLQRWAFDNAIIAATKGSK